MKKRILFCLAALGVSSMLFGFDSAETADSLIEKVQSAAEGAEGVTLGMGMNLDASVNIEDSEASSSINFKASGDFDIAANADPVAMSMDGSMTISGITDEQTVTMKSYMVTAEDGTVDNYTYTEDSLTGEGGWIHQNTAAAKDIDLAALAKKTSDLDLAEYGIDFALAPEAADVDGTECYLLSTTIDSAAFRKVYDKAVTYLSEEEAEQVSALSEMVLSMLDGVKVNLSYYIDTASYLPVKFHIDLDGTDLSAVSQFLAMAMGEMAEGSSISIALNDASIDVMTSYGPANDITVPEEAIANAEEITAEDLSSLGDMIGEDSAE